MIRWSYRFLSNYRMLPAHDNTNKVAYEPREDSDQPGHPPSLIRVFVVRTKKPWVLSFPISAKRRLWSDWTDAQADLRLRWAQSHFGGFIVLQIKYYLIRSKRASRGSCCTVFPVLFMSAFPFSPGRIVNTRIIPSITALKVVVR